MRQEVTKIPTQPLSDQLHDHAMLRLYDHIQEQQSHNQLRQKFPDALNWFPLNLSKTFQKIILKLLELLSRHQRTINGKVATSFEQVLNLQKLLRQELSMLQEDVRNLKIRAEISRNREDALSQQLGETENYSGMSFTANPEDPERYLRYLEKSKDLTGDAPLFDLSRGRSEWLKFLKSSGFRAQKNTLLGLIETPHSSLSAVTALYLIERLTFSELIQIIDEAFRVIKPGGLLIFETATFQNKPIPMEVLKNLLELRGFKKTETLLLSQSYSLIGFRP